MLEAIILAGGLGTRLRTVVPDLPKPMAPINNRPFLEWQMDYWISQGVKRFVISVGYCKEVIISHFGASYRGVAVDYAVEDKQLGTGGGLLLAVGMVNQCQPVLVLNGDTFFEVNLSKLIAFHEMNNSSWTFSLFKSNEINRYMGIDVDTSGLISSFDCKNKISSCLVNGGVYIINPKIISQTSFSVGDVISLEKDLLNELVIKKVSLYGIEFSGVFVDIGVPDDYAKAFSLLK